MGAPRKNFLAEHHQTWRLFTFPFLHAGVFHLVINLCSVIYAGIHLEQEFGPLRIGIIYILSAFVGALVASLFLQNIPVVGASGALFGLLGTLLSELVWNKKFHNNKITEIASLVFVFVCNFLLGFLPYVVNFSNIGGFISGFLLGTVLLLSPQFQQVAPSKGDQIDYSLKSYMLKFKQKPDRSVTRIVSLILFTMLLAGCLVAVHYGINIKGEDVGKKKRRRRNLIEKERKFMKRRTNLVEKLRVRMNKSVLEEEDQDCCYPQYSERKVSKAERIKAI
ncbi:RHOMBOID-like protein 8 [Trifolium pratense]|uniref:RHOMBOID-like protein 8 n=1 Tax=Trifolium pratense TaxID=57577 RepID=UPI001E693B87|nr:RHOMBOID-like protein 8 [Trifolium pratense]